MTGINTIMFLIKSKYYYKTDHINSTSYIYVFQNIVLTKNKICLILYYMEYLLFNIFNKEYDI